MAFPDIGDLIKTPLNKILSLVGTELRQTFSNRILEYQTEEYKRNLYAKTILHRAEPKLLSDFYIPLKIKEYKKEQPITKRTATDSCKKLFHKKRYLTLIGTAGSGKSTLVKYLFTKCIEEGFKIPIKIELRYLNDYKGKIHDYIFIEIFKYQKLGLTETIIERLLDSGAFIFFFDGYDELSSIIKEHTTADIDNFVNRFNSNCYLITSRPYTSIDLLPLFSNYQVCDLAEDEIAKFVKKQIPIEEVEIAEKIIKAINKGENNGYRSFLSNPLLLSMFILTFQSYADVPQKRSDFYDQVFVTLFSVHDSMSKLAYVREKQSGLNKEQFEEILRLFSFLSFFEEKFLFPINYLEDKLNVIKSKKKNIDFQNTKFIEDLQVAIGILNIEGLDYAFPHRSLQEYFSASYIKSLSPENKKTIYGKLKSSIGQNLRELFSKEHFYRLLSEIDYYYVTTELTIPLIEELYIDCKKQKNISIGFAYLAYGNLILVSHFLLDAEQYHNEFYNDLFLCDGDAPRYVFFPVHKIESYMRAGEKFSQMFHDEIDIQKIIKIIERFKFNGASLIYSIKSVLEDLNKSDQEIISLI
jgi:predicted NACHT family NTPase